MGHDAVDSDRCERQTAREQARTDQKSHGKRGLARQQDPTHPAPTDSAPLALESF